MPTAAAIAGSAVIGAVSSSRAASKQAKQTRKGIEAQTELLGPFTQAGTQGLGAVQQFVDEGASVNFSDTQAFKDIVNTQKARGQNLSGNTLTELARFNAVNFRPQRLQELAFLPTLGANTAGGQATNVGNLFQSLGSTRAAGALGVGNAAQSGLNSLAFLSLLNQGNTGSGGGFSGQFGGPSGGFGAPVNFGR